MVLLLFVFDSNVFLMRCIISLQCTLSHHDVFAKLLLLLVVDSIVTSTRCSISYNVIQEVIL